MSKPQSRAEAFARLAAIQTAILAAGLVVVELALRLFLPLPPHGGEYRDASGNAVRIARDAETLQPRLDVRHIASEFAAQIRTGDLGYRKMSKESAAPDFLFLGDSFTFGHGVSDDQAFPEIFCGKRSAACLNLGRSGANTFDQVRILRHEIGANALRPKTVVLTMLAACWLGAAGNDLGDNLAFQRNARRGSFVSPVILPQPVRADLSPWMTDAMRALQRWFSDFEITKRVLIVASSGLKRGAYACSPANELEAATNATSAALGELATLAEQHGFQVKVVVIHPYQDLDGGFRNSEAAVSRALPKAAGCVATGEKFRSEHYYPYDGHFNASGHANLAMILDALIDNAPNACASP
jgi:hypothetical protein